MICPKCQNQMRTVDKNGVHIDQCEGCRGIFLDRGELEAISGAESSFYGQAPPPYGAPVPQYGRGDSPRPYRGGHPDSPKGYRGGGYSDSPRPHRGGYSDSPRPYGHGHRKRGFLENLFD
ncbi:zf-TFIIB domain-containing protein [Amycolatopsis sp., V23-08]|uniref:Zf-TFIIB domain-containing protein n=1 Tax=Amycolatopsis heterodermiae TaxID=3110235 RepID=A0ABU5R7I6_9PSEU|nr:zf-TFIIB domain-containing protein [Amycolatopsis sp., V23-08]MEA5361805.1 zf-TFIIB domain-containing protein [Amycolatopsis sp., V23-08]